MMTEENRPMTAEGYVVSELYKAKDHEEKFVADLEDTRERVEELEEELSLVRKVLRLFNFHIDGDEWLQGDEHYIHLNKVGRETANKFLAIIRSDSDNV